jgi:hypothetical protein
VLHGDGPIDADKLQDRIRNAQYSGYACYEARCEFSPEEGAIVAYKVYIGRKKYFVLCDIGNGMQEWYAGRTRAREPPAVCRALPLALIRSH